MATRIVATGMAKDVPLYGSGCNCPYCRGQRSSQSKIFATDTEPAIRTINFALMTGPSQARSGLHRLRLPYVRTLIGYTPLETAQEGAIRYTWNGLIRVYGCLEPYNNLDQPVFPLPLPNMDKSGYLTCAGTMTDGLQPSVDPLTMCLNVLTAFWNTPFSYWVESWPTGRDFQVLQGGVATLKKIPTKFSLSQFVSDGQPKGATKCKIQ